MKHSISGRMEHACTVRNLPAQCPGYFGVYRLPASLTTSCQNTTSALTDRANCSNAGHIASYMLTPHAVLPHAQPGYQRRPRATRQPASRLYVCRVSPRLNGCTMRATPERVIVPGLRPSHPAPRRTQPMHLACRSIGNLARSRPRPNPAITGRHCAPPGAVLRCLRDFYAPTLLARQYEAWRRVPRCGALAWSQRGCPCPIP